MAEDKKKQVEAELNDEQLDEVNGGGLDGLTIKELHELNIEMGQYDAKLETMSSVTKSLQDMLKSLN